VKDATATAPLLPSLLGHVPVEKEEERPEAGKAEKIVAHSVYSFLLW
jgi:hypothetical protein